MLLFPTADVQTYLFAKRLHSNGCCMALILQLLPSNRSTCHIPPSLRLFIPNSLQIYRYFLFSKGCACDICDWSQLPSLWLISQGDYSPTAPTAPSLRLLVPWCELVQASYHHLRSGVPLDLVYTSFIRVTTLYETSHMDWSLGDFPFVWVGRKRHPVALVAARAAGQSVVASFYPVTGWLNPECCVDGPLNLPRDQLWVILYPNPSGVMQ
jgi:hypothetical protein